MPQPDEQKDASEQALATRVLQVELQLAALSLPPPGGGGLEGARRKAVWHARKSLQYALVWAVGAGTPFALAWLLDLLHRVMQ